MIVTNFWGENSEVRDEHAEMCSLAPLSYNIAVKEGYITVRRRRVDCLWKNSHEPRPWIVCYARPLKPGQHPHSVFSDITFHSTLGARFGAFSRVGEMIEEYTKGKM